MPIACAHLEGLRNTYAALLRSCSLRRAVWDGTRLHHEIVQHGLHQDKLLGRLLVHMYGHCAAFEDACRCLHTCTFEDVVAWNFLLGSYVQHGQSKAAIQLFAQFLEKGFAFDTFTLRQIICACASEKALTCGQCVHDLVMHGALEMDVFLASALISLYSKCGSVDDADAVFIRAPGRNVVLWNAILGAHEQNCQQGQDVFWMFEQMQCEAIAPDRVTFVTILSFCASHAPTGACGASAAIHVGKRIHSRIFQSECNSDPDVSNAVINMYGKCNRLKEAHEVFTQWSKHSSVLCNTMVAAYAEHGYENEAVHLFYRMQCEGFIPDKVTYINMLSVYARPSALVDGKRLHSRIKGSGFDADVVVATALVTMYGRCGCLGDARRTFETMKECNLISWNAMLSVYAQHGLGREVLDVFHRMTKASIRPNKSTFLSLISACATEASLMLGRIIHTWILCYMFESHVDISSALTNMYTKCGSLGESFALFDQLESRDLISWNVVVSSYGQHGHGDDVLHLYQLMQGEGSSPNLVTLVGVFYACTHSGLLEDAHRCLVSAYCEHDVAPVIEHLDGLIDMLGRAGQLDEAVVVVCGMPFQPSAVSWMILLGACRLHSDVQLGEIVTKLMFELDSEDLAACVMLSNIYYAAGMWDEGDQARDIGRYRYNGVGSSAGL